MRTLYRIHLREILFNPSKLFTALLLTGLYSSLDVLRLGLSMGTFSSVMCIVILGGGTLSQEYGSSMLHLVLARPIKRWQYICSKWLALGSAATLILGLFALLAAGQIYRSSGVFSGVDLLKQLAVDGLIAFQGGALLIFLSAWVPWRLEGLVYMVLAFPQFIGIVGMIFGFSGTTFERMAGWFYPGIELANRIVSNELRWVDLSLYAVTTLVCIAGACWVMNRREFSYAK